MIPYGFIPVDQLFLQKLTAHLSYTGKNGRTANIPCSSRALLELVKVEAKSSTWLCPLNSRAACLYLVIPSSERKGLQIMALDSGL